MNDKAEIDRILCEGAEKADAVAQPILDQAYDIAGFLRSRKR